MNERSARAMLGVSPSATTGQIKRAYRQLALELHPDRGGDPLAFQRLVEAQRLLLASSTSQPRTRWMQTSSVSRTSSVPTPRPVRRPVRRQREAADLRRPRRFGDVLAEKLAAA